MDKNEGLGGEDVVMQQYPSPTADGQDNGPFYNTNHQRDQQTDHPSEQQQHGHSMAHQHGRRGSVSAEELQLAAQLTQGLAPIMAAADNAPGDSALDNQDPNLHNGQPKPDGPNGESQNPGHPQPDASFHHEDHRMQGEEHNGHDQSEHNLHHLMRQSGLPVQEGQLHQYGEHPPPPQGHLPSQDLAPQLQLAQLAQQQYAATPDQTPPRKRSKVSRACDECRRKKVKCDAPSEMGEQPCSNCRRSNIRCLFSRVPQKRGPSKGYIKELADRIHHIEGKLGGQGARVEGLDLAGGSARESADSLSQALHLDENRKRPIGSISGDNFSTPVHIKHAAWGSEPRPIQPYQTPSDRSRPPYSVNSLAPQPLRGDGPAASQPTASMDSLAVEFPTDHVREIDEAVFFA